VHCDSSLLAGPAACAAPQPGNSLLLRRDVASPEFFGASLARRLTSRRRLPTSKGLRRSHSCPAETERSLLRRHSLGVDGFLRVCRARLAARWFAAPTSTFSPLGAGPCRFRRTRWLVANASRRVSPLKLHLSLRAPGLPPVLPPSRPKGGPTVRRFPLLRFFAPPVLEV